MTIDAVTDATQWESGEADWDSDDSYEDDFGEDTEDIGEARRRSRNRQPRYRRLQGVRGVRLHGRDGSPQTLRFPQNVARVDETNNALRALDAKLTQLETRYGRQLKNDSSVTGVVTLTVGGGLTAFSAFQAAEDQSGGSKLAVWKNSEATKMASVISVTQLATTGAKLLVNRRSSWTPLGVAADIFAAGQLATYVYGMFSSTVLPTGTPHFVTFETAGKDLNTYKVGDTVIIKDVGIARVVAGSNGQLTLDYN